jgi:site-specific DNA-methyltransferase (adenine-specific)
VFNTPRNSAYILHHAELHGLLFENWITWDKRDGFSTTKKRFVPCQETITFFSKQGGEKTFNPDAVRVPYDSSERIAAAATKGILKNGKRWFPNELGKLCTDVWHITSERHKQKVRGRVTKTAHPTQKPVELIERIIQASSNPNDLVLDCFMGSGTTAVAALRLGRRFLGCEFDPDFYSLASKRVNDEKRSPDS